MWKRLMKCWKEPNLFFSFWCYAISFCLFDIMTTLTAKLMQHVVQGLHQFHSLQDRSRFTTSRHLSATVYLCDGSSAQWDAATTATLKCSWCRSRTKYISVCNIRGGLHISICLGVWGRGVRREGRQLGWREGQWRQQASSRSLPEVVTVSWGQQGIQITLVLTSSSFAARGVPEDEEERDDEEDEDREEEEEEEEEEEDDAEEEEEESWTVAGLS